MKKNVITKAWSLKEEGKLNKNNIIFKPDFPLNRILRGMHKVNEDLKKKRSRE